ncbi:MAG: protein jag [Deltaproteobacteria bacterium CG_4_8_14_3_um_filter_45_9]|nr:MAG: protein jag [Deltaproteobacteria bacterium CG03_land_8_20_14_0_80_45_14]PIX21239.1 MAG: protein jag [Deltaproteobacteria bacterium CG_4_8_14_3_um_filter_45_9]
MEEIEIAKQLTIGLLERMGVKTEVEGFLKEGALCLEIKGDQEGILIGKHGRTLESLQLLINRMVHKRLKNAMRVILDIDDYRKRRADSMAEMAHRLGEKAKGTGHSLTVGPFNAHDRRIIHVTLKEDPSLKTESLGEGELKKVKIIPMKKEG